MRLLILLALIAPLSACGYKFVPRDDAHTVATVDGLHKIAQLARDLDTIK